MVIEKNNIYINCNIGCNTAETYYSEIEKIKAIKASNVIPDMMMDLSLYKSHKPLYRIIQEELKIPVGTVLSYIPFSKQIGLEWETIKDYLIQLGEDGVSFVTIHFTANNYLLDLANSRQNLTTSRGGGICLYDIKYNHRENNIFLEHIDEIIEIVLKYDITISLGTTFRPGNIFDACDSVHTEETLQQLKICTYLQSKGVKVIVENIGHIPLNKLETHAELLKRFNAPIMPLGPIPTDMAAGQDHISSAIGAAFSAYWGIATIINCITRNEHVKAEITAIETIESIKAMKVVQQIMNTANQKPDALSSERNIVMSRSKINSCMLSDEICTRCLDVCPLKII